MMKPTYVIAIAAIILAASFAGIAVMGDDADAAESDEAFIITYQGEIGVLTQTVENENGTVTLYGDPDSENGNADLDKIIGDYDKTVYELTGWTTGGETPVIYNLGATIKPSADVTLYPVIEVKEGAAAMFFVVEDETFIIKETMQDSTGTGKVTLSKDVLDAIEAYKAEGYIFNGWFDGEDKYVVADDQTGTYTAGKTITADLERVYDVAFYFDETTKLTTLKSSVIDVDGLSETLPDAPSKANFTFKGWETADGVMVFIYDALNDKYVMKEGFEFTSDINLYASFEANGLVVTFVYGEDKAVFGTVNVNYGGTILAPEPPEGYKGWDFDFSTPITSNITIEAVASDAPVIDEAVNVTFKIEGKDPYTYPVSDRLQVPSTVREGYSFLGWTIEGTDAAMMTTEKVQSDIRTGVYTEDTVFVAVYEIAEPPAPEEPAFYETTTGQVAIVFIVFIVLLFGYGVYSNAFGLKDKLFGYKITKKSKEDKKE